MAATEYPKAPVLTGLRLAAGAQALLVPVVVVWAGISGSQYLDVRFTSVFADVMLETAPNLKWVMAAVSLLAAALALALLKSGDRSVQYLALSLAGLGFLISAEFLGRGASAPGVDILAGFLIVESFAAASFAYGLVRHAVEFPVPISERWLEQGEAAVHEARTNRRHWRARRVLRVAGWLIALAFLVWCVYWAVAREPRYALYIFAFMLIPAAHPRLSYIEVLRQYARSILYDIGLGDRPESELLSKSLFHYSVELHQRSAANLAGFIAILSLLATIGTLLTLTNDVGVVFVRARRLIEAACLLGLMVAGGAAFGYITTRSRFGSVDERLRVRWMAAAFALPAIAVVATMVLINATFLILALLDTDTRILSMSHQWRATFWATNYLIVVLPALILASWMALLMFASLNRGDLDPALAMRRSTLLGILGLAFTFVFVLTEVLLETLIADWVGLSDRMGAMLAGVLAALTVTPVKSRLDRISKGWAERLLPGQDKPGA